MIFHWLCREREDDPAGGLAFLDRGMQLAQFSK
jgi:hypothetical protein